MRHLVMPNGLAGTEEILDFIAGRVSTRTYVNIMDQYHPCGRALSNEAFMPAAADHNARIIKTSG